MRAFIRLALLVFATFPFPIEAAPARAPAEFLERAFGLEAVSLRPASDGHLLYFRYKVVDASKARSLLDGHLDPLLIDHATGKALHEDATLGTLRSGLRSEPINGKEYLILFSNPALLVKKASRADVALGDCRFENLVVD